METDCRDDCLQNAVPATTKIKASQYADSLVGIMGSSPWLAAQARDPRMRKGVKDDNGGIVTSQWDPLSAGARRGAVASGNVVSTPVVISDRRTPVLSDHTP